MLRRALDMLLVWSLQSEEHRHDSTPRHVATGAREFLARIRLQRGLRGHAGAHAPTRGPAPPPPAGGRGRPAALEHVAESVSVAVRLHGRTPRAHGRDEG